MKFLLRFTPVTIEAPSAKEAEDLVERGEYDQPWVDTIVQVSEQPAREVANG